MEDKIRALARIHSCVGVAQIALDKLYLVEKPLQVLVFSGFKIIQPENSFSTSDEGFSERRSNKPGAAGYKINRHFFCIVSARCVR